MSVVVRRHKHLKLDQRKIDVAKRYFGVTSKQEAIDRALALRGFGTGASHVRGSGVRGSGFDFLALIEPDRLPGDPVGEAPCP
jgi:hypothetical protein